jgi:hypothetical protein
MVKESASDRTTFYLQACRIDLGLELSLMMKRGPSTSVRSMLIAVILFVTSHALAHAQGGCITSGGGCAPEIDASLGTGGVALLSGVVLLMRSRPRR